jgi:hypothetical protein
MRHGQRTTIYCLCASLASTACATLTGAGDLLEVSRSERAKLESEYLGKELVLATPLFVGEFFGDARFLFADPRPEEIIDLWTAAGEKVDVPTMTRPMVPAETPVRVKEIVLPRTPIATLMAGRGGQLPTAHPWLILERLDGRGEASPFIVVLPRELKDDADLRTAIRARIGTRESVANWYGWREPVILSHIRRKEVAPGMSLAEMLAALGRPRSVKYAAGDANLDQVADYGNLQVFLRGDIVSQVRDVKADAARKEREHQEAVAAEERRLAEARAKERVEAEQKRVQREQEQLQLDQERRASEERQAVAAARQAARDTANRLRNDERTADLESHVAEARRELEAALAKERATAAWVTEQLTPAVTEAEAQLASLQETAEVSGKEVDEGVARARELCAEAAKDNGDRAAAERRLRRALATARTVSGKTDAAVARATEKVAVARRELQRNVNAVTARSRELESQLELLGRSVLGLRIAPVTAALDKRVRAVAGAWIVGVEADSPAERAGVRANDVILEVRGTKVAGALELANLITESPTANGLDFTTWREGKRLQLTLPAPGAAPAKTRAPVDAGAQRLSTAGPRLARFGRN